MKKTVLFFLLLLILGIGNNTYAQVGINTDGSNPHPSAGLDVSFPDKGFLPPRVNVVEDINDPAPGLIAYETSTNQLKYFNGTEWVGMPYGTQQLVFTEEITSSEILGIHFFPKQMAPSPGVGNQYLVLGVKASYSIGSIPYTGTGCLGLSLYQGNSASGLFDEPEPEVILRGNNSASVQFVGKGGLVSSNSPLMLWEPGASYTNGNGTLKVTVVCIIVPE